MNQYIKGGLAAILVVASLTAGIGISTAQAHSGGLTSCGDHRDHSKGERHTHNEEMHDQCMKTLGISAAVLAALWVLSETMDDSKFVDQLLPPHREDSIDWDFNASADGARIEIGIPFDL